MTITASRIRIVFVVSVAILAIDLGMDVIEK
jgi:hypothetical protein